MPASRDRAGGRPRHTAAASLSVSPLDLRSGWKTGRCAADGNTHRVRQDVMPPAAVPRRGMAWIPFRQSRPGSATAGAAAAAAGADDRQLSHGADEAALSGGRGLADQLEVRDRELHGGLSSVAAAPDDP